MSLFPVGVWGSPIARREQRGVGDPWCWLFVVGFVLLMSWLSARWLKGAGVDHSAASAAPVTGTALSLPVFTGFLAPFPGRSTLLSAALAEGLP